jgi:conjugal transfer mating pair stabilization protein TraG
MPTFTIYAASDDTYLRYVLNALAMLQSTGTFAALGAIGLILGILLAVARGAQGDAKGLPAIFIGLVTYMICFGQTVTVYVQGSLASTWYTAQSYTVANVPIGPAMAGMIISNIGEGLSSRMVQAFSFPGYDQQNILNAGYNRSLDWLTIGQYFKDPELNSPDGKFGVYRDNLLAYVESCTSKMLQVNPSRSSGMFTTGTPFDTITGIGFNSTWDQFNYINSQTNAVSQMSCAAGATQLKTDEQSILPLSLPSAVAAAMHDNPTQAPQDLSNAWQIYGAQQQDWVRFLGNQMINEAMLEAGPNIPGLNQGQINNILMVKAGALQRAQKYAGEESLFRRMIGPMMSFLEAMLYISAPFMAFAMCLGAFGLKGLTRYLSLAVSVAMWIPILSAIDLFQIVRVNEILAPYLDPNLSQGQLGTILSTMTAYGDIDDIIATGSWLTVTMPSLVTFAVMGSGFALSQIYGGMRGGDVVNYKTNAPDPVNAPPAMNMSAPMEKSGAGVAHTSGASMPTFTVGSSLSASEAQQRVQSDSRTMGSTVSHALNAARSSMSSSGTTGVSSVGSSGSTAVSAGQTTSDGNSVGTTTSIGQGADQTTKSGVSDSHKVSAFGNTSSQLKAGVSAGTAGSSSEGGGTSAKSSGGEGISKMLSSAKSFAANFGGSGSYTGGWNRGTTNEGGVSSQHGSDFSNSQHGDKSTSAGHSTNAQTSSGFVQQLSELASRMNSMSASQMASFSKGVTDGQAQQLSRAFGDANQYTSALQSQRSSGVGQQVPLDQGIQSYTNSAGGGNSTTAAQKALQAYQEAGGDPGAIVKDAYNPTGSLSSAFGDDKNSRVIGGVLVAMSSSSNPAMQAAFADMASSNGITALAPLDHGPSGPSASTGDTIKSVDSSTSGSTFTPDAGAVLQNVQHGEKSGGGHSGGAVAPPNSQLESMATGVSGKFNQQTQANLGAVGAGTGQVNSTFGQFSKEIGDTQGQVRAGILKDNHEVPAAIGAGLMETGDAAGGATFEAIHPNSGGSKETIPRGHGGQSGPAPSPRGTPPASGAEPNEKQP